MSRINKTVVAYLRNKAEAQALECKDMADMCELAHERTVARCALKGVPVDCNAPMQDGECIIHITSDIHYSDLAQDIFNDYYGDIEELTGL